MGEERPVISVVAKLLRKLLICFQYSILLVFLYCISQLLALVNTDRNNLGRNRLKGVEVHSLRSGGTISLESDEGGAWGNVCRRRVT